MKPIEEWKDHEQPQKDVVLTAPEPKAGTKFVKVRLDGRTVVHLKSMKAFPFWKSRYPKAEVID